MVYAETVRERRLEGRSAGNSSMPFGATVLPDDRGVQFRLWAPTAQTVELLIDERAYPLQADPKGWFSAIVPEAHAGILYQYRINQTITVPDPASRCQPQDVHGPSQVIDPARFQWRDVAWNGCPWETVILYELHVGTFTPEGTFKALQEKLDYLLELGVTAIELMPIAECPGVRNWGYDGVLPFAPENRYGTPDDLKALIQAAHEKGLMVFLDVVYNHFGPEGNYLHTYAESFFTDKYDTPWGAAIHFEGAPEVRDFFIWNAIYWVNEYHFDGLRFDAVHAIRDASAKHFLTELAERVRAAVSPARQIHLVLENDDNLSRFLTGKTEGHDAETPVKSGFNAQWNDDFHHAFHVLLTGEQGGYYADYAKQTSARPAIAHLARCLTEGFAYQGEASPYRHQEIRGEKSRHLPLSAFVNFLQNHDQIGNRAFGERLSVLAPPQAMRAALTVLLLQPAVPMLFMGEEWQTRQPFQFFCDFGPELAPLVREGRRKEFARFPAFSDPANRERIPDPGALSTFRNSALDWESLDIPSHAAWFEWCKQRIATRKQAILPRLLRAGSGENMKRGYELFESTGLLAWWRFSDGETLLLAANLGAEPLTFRTSEHHNLVKLRDAELLFESEPAAFDRLCADRLPEWSAVWLIVP
jgi:maltooligosyltrehalose trehalohydrolase